jgi:hypothetical protein
MERFNSEKDVGRNVVVEIFWEGNGLDNTLETLNRL